MVSLFTDRVNSPYDKTYKNLSKMSSNYVPEFFTEDEFVRVGCHMSDVNKSSLYRLDCCRRDAGIPFIINSAYRSPSSDIAAGRSGKGAHTLGRAFDISCKDNLSRFKIVKSALMNGFNRIGIGHTFIHLDDCDEREGLPSPRIWYYNY